MTMETLDTIDHVAVVVDDIDTALAWYQAHFNCDVQWHDESWAFLRFGNCGLALVTPEQHPPHFAITAANIARFGTPQTHRDGTRFVYLDDGSGNTVEMLERLPTV